MNAVEIDWTEEITEADYVDILNENYPSVDICGFEMYQGAILKECDYVAFRESYNNYIDSEEKDRGSYKCGECGDMWTTDIDAEECCKEDGH